MGYYQIFETAAGRFADRVAIEVQRREGLERWTYQELRLKVESYSAAVAYHGVSRGDRCALLADNDAAWCAAYLGILRIGAVPVPLDTTYKDSQVARLLEDSGARLIVTTARFEEAVEKARAGRDCPVILLEDSLDDAVAVPAVDAADDETAVILYTSGTTSDPKGVVLTHGNLHGEKRAALGVITIEKEDAVLGVLPLFHALAQVANLVLPLSVGARVVFLETISSGELLRALREREISVFCCVPQFFYLIHERVLAEVSRAGRLKRFLFRTLLSVSGFLRERLGFNAGRTLFRRVHESVGPRMRLFITGGSRFDRRIGRDLFRLGFNILQAYGLTETTGGATVLRPGDKHVDSVGQALVGVELKIVPNEKVAEGQTETEEGYRIGEVAIRGAVVSPGYYRRDDVNAVTFRDGWLHTGDLGYLDGEGRLYITGRAKEMIVLGSGKNIYPEEIEAHYARSPFIKELCVMGRALPDAPASERLHAVVVPDFELLRERKIFNSRDWVRFEIENLSAELPGHKRILSYDVITEDLPRTTTRKLKRFEIERRYAAGSGESPEAPATVAADSEETGWEASPHVARTLEVVRAVAGSSVPIRPAANLELDLGLDSMARVELLAALESRFGTSVPEEVSHNIHSVGELVEAFRPAASEALEQGDGEFDPWRNLLDEVSDEDPAVAPVLAHRPLASVLLFGVAKMIYAFGRLFLGLRVSGREHLPARGPFLISPNHQSFLDAFLLASVLPYRVFRDTFYVGASEYFANRVSAWFARLIRVVPVDPDTNLIQAMRAGAQGLRRGKVLILFPEGERSIDREMKAFKKGAAILSLKVGAPVVPVALDGAHDLWPRGGRPRLWKLLPFTGTRTQFRFGPALEGHAVEAYATFTERLRGAIGEMLGAMRGRAGSME